MISTMSFSSYYYFSNYQFKWLITAVKMTSDFWPFKSHIPKENMGMNIRLGKQENKKLNKIYLLMKYGNEFFWALIVYFLSS